MLRIGSIPSLPKVLVPDTDPVPICVLGDPAYPLLPYKMKEFPGRGSTSQEQFKLANCKEFSNRKYMTLPGDSFSEVWCFRDHT